MLERICRVYHILAKICRLPAGLLVSIRAFAGTEGPSQVFTTIQCLHPVRYEFR